MSNLRFVCVKAVGYRLPGPGFRPRIVKRGEIVEGSNSVVSDNPSHFRPASRGDEKFTIGKWSSNEDE